MPGVSSGPRAAQCRGSGVAVAAIDTSHVVELHLYDRDCVVGGPGDFMVPVRDKPEFATAIRTKIELEVADTAGSVPQILPVQGFSRARCAATGRRSGYDRDDPLEGTATRTPLGSCRLRPAEAWRSRTMMIGGSRYG